MENILKHLCESKKYACIYTNVNDSSAFIYGKILYVNDTHLIIYSLSKDGDFDGIFTKETSDIIRIEIDGQYSNMMNKLVNNKNLPKIEITIQNNDVIISMLKYAEETKKITVVELINSGYDDIIGFVEFSDTKICKMHQIDMYGIEDGTSIIPVTSISHLCVGSLDEQRRDDLYRINQLTIKNTKK